MVPEYKLATPEAISIRYDLAGIGTRFLAAAIDFLAWIVLAIILAVGALALGTFGALGRSTALILFGTLSFLILYGYYIIFETLWEGQTPGKRIMKIRVIRRTGHAIGFADAFIRNVVRIVDFLPSFYGVGVITMFISPESRRLGDYAAGTIVVLERAPLTIAAIAPEPARIVSQPALGAVDPDELRWDVRALDSEDLLLMQHYLDRSRNLPADASLAIGHTLAARIANRIGARAPLDPGQFVERVLYLREQRGAE